MPGVARAVGVLRGASRLVLLDAGGRPLDAIPTSVHPTAVAVGSDGEVLVVTEVGSMLERFVVAGDRLAPAGSVVLPDVRAMRDVSVGEGAVLVVDELEPRVVTLVLERDATSFSVSARRDLPTPPGTLRATVQAGVVHLLSTLDRSVSVHDLEADGGPSAGRVTRIRHDGPPWASAAARGAGSLWVAVGGVEDRPLDRTIGSFGWVDSFLWLYELPDGPGGPARRALEVNLSERGVLTPKAIDLEVVGDGVIRLRAMGAGSGRSALVEWRPDGEPRVVTFEHPPGTSALASLGGGRWLSANPLLDAWIAMDAETTTVVGAEAPTDSDGPTREERLGEALFFTEAMAPWNQSRGALSRFTCETCHFEGYVDGRTHATGRGTVRATTKPLLGLLSNRPYFSRALDRDLARMVHAEFRVASANSGRDPWFALAVDELPWLAGFTDEPVIEPLALRRALMAFLARFTHRPNPAAWGRTAWTGEEARGAEAFRARCERCHSARLVADDEESTVPFERWESLTLSASGALVWGRTGYEKTGVEPYVHPDGARVPSLRRLYKKRPYFTNGSARELRDVLEAVRFDGGRLLHRAAGEPAGMTPLDPAEIRVLLAFLRIL